MKNKEVTFTKGQIVSSSKFQRVDRDILASLLEEDKYYTLEECKKIIDKFKKKVIE